MDTILIIDPDPAQQQALTAALETEGLRGRCAGSGREGLREALQAQPRLIVLELALPDMEGWEACRIFRKQPETSNVPLMIVSEHGAELERIMGFELGVDDYVVKPCPSREVALRIKAILRRMNPPGEFTERLQVGELTLDVSASDARIGGRSLNLTSTEFRLLQHLLRRPERVQTREMLLAQVWETNPRETDARTVDTHIRRLRKKLGYLDYTIKTVRRLGYLFRPPTPDNKP